MIIVNKNCTIEEWYKTKFIIKVSNLFMTLTADFANKWKFLVKPKLAAAT